MALQTQKLVIKRMTPTHGSQSDEQFVIPPTKRADHDYLLFGDEGDGIERTEDQIEYIIRTVESFGPIELAQISRKTDAQHLQRTTGVQP